MPLEIVRNDITNMCVDAIVNTANPQPIVGSGTDAGINKKAGSKLLNERKFLIGEIPYGSAAITNAYELEAEYVIHATGAVWIDGNHGEEELLRRSYRKALELAAEKNCKSIAFPLLSSGNNGFPRVLALKVAVSEFNNFLFDNDMDIYLVVFSKEAVDLSQKLYKSVASYIDENYVSEKENDELWPDYDDSQIHDGLCSSRFKLDRKRRERERLFYENRYEKAELDETRSVEPCLDESAKVLAPINGFEGAVKAMSIGEMLTDIDSSFSERLQELIDVSGKKAPEICNRFFISRKLFFKIKSDPLYKTSKKTAVAFALALHLNLEETQDLIGRAGFTLTKSDKFDLIVMYFIERGEYDVFKINDVLFEFDQMIFG